MTVNSTILLKKIRDDSFSIKMFFLICLIGTSSLISLGVSDTIFGVVTDINEAASTFTLFSIIASVVIFAPMVGIMLGADVFTESGREIIFGCISRKEYLISRLIGAALVLLIGALLSITTPLFISYTQIQAIELDDNFLLAIFCIISFSFVFVSASACFSVVANSTIASLVLGTIYTTIEFGIGFIGYAYSIKSLYYFSPHALLMKGVLPENGELTIQLISITVLLVHSLIFVGISYYYAEKRDL